MAVLLSAGVLALACASPSAVREKLEDAKVSMAEAQLAELHKDLLVLVMSGRELPSSLEAAGFKSTDPWNNPIGYTIDGNGWTLTSYGSDGAPGGVGTAADLVKQR